MKVSTAMTPVDTCAAVCKRALRIVVRGQATYLGDFDLRVERRGGGGGDEHDDEHGPLHGNEGDERLLDAIERVAAFHREMAAQMPLG